MHMACQPGGASDAFVCMRPGAPAAEASDAPVVPWARARLKLAARPDSRSNDEGNADEAFDTRAHLGRRLEGLFALSTSRTARRLIAIAALVTAMGVALGLVFRHDPSPQSVRAQWESPPNVVLIIIDTLRQDKVGAYGFPMATSPELDLMAHEGVRFDRVIAQSSWTRPSTGAMLTSLYPRTLGIYNEKGQILPDRVVTLAEALKQAGYTTLGATANANINSSFNFHQGFDHYLDSTVLPALGGDERHGSRPSKAESARQVFDSLIAQVKKSDDPPYYLQANVMEVHEQWDERVNLEKYEPLFDRAPARRYLAAIRLVSEEISRFVDALKALPGFERTLFVVVSDHGEGLSDHHPVSHSATHGFLLYESQVLVPLIFYATDDSLPRGKVVEGPCRLLDLMPTLLDYLGIEAPTGIAGKSMMPAIDGDESPELPPRFVTETYLRSAEAIGVYGSGWEYIEHRKPHPGTDSYELQATEGYERGSKTNQIDARPEIAASMRAFLEQWERRHPRSEPTRLKAPLSALEEQQLRELGYIE